MAVNHTYIAIDLKSFYASVECRERGLDPLTTNLVVAEMKSSQYYIDNYQYNSIQYFFPLYI